jgi:uridine kinase
MHKPTSVKLVDMNIPIPADLIDRLSKITRPALVAIGGFGGSGKSSLAQALKDSLPSVSIIAMDDFIVKERVLDDSWDNGAYDQVRLKEQILVPFRSGQPIKYQKLNWSTNTLSEPLEVAVSDIVIVEGISSYNPDNAEYFDFKIWVDAKIEVARERGRARDGDNENAQHWDLWAQNDLKYLEKHHPEKLADYTFVNG